MIYAVLSGRLDAATVKQIALNTAMNLNPAGIIAAGVGLLATALMGFALSATGASSDTDGLSDSIEELNQNAKELNQIAEDSDQAAKKVHSLIEEYKSIKTASDNTEEAKQRLKEIQDVLVSTYDVEAEKLDLVNGKYEEQLGILKQVGNKKDEVAKLDSKAAYYAAVESQKQGSSFSLGEYLYGYTAPIDSLFNEINYSGAQLKSKSSSGNMHEMTISFDTSTTFEDRVNFLTEFAKVLDEKINDPNTSSDNRRDYQQAFQLVVDALNENSTWLKDYNTALDRYNYYYGTDNDESTDTPTSSSKKSGDILDIESQKKTYKTIRDELKKEYELGEIDAATYYSKLEALRDKYLSYAVESDEWHDATLEIKKYRDQLTEEQKKAYEQQVAAQKKAAEEAATARKQAYTEEKSQLEFKLKTNQISEKKYYTELTKIRDKYLDKNSSEWRSAYLETYEYNQKIIQANKDALNQLLSDTSDSTLDALDKLISSRDSLTNKLKDFNKTFEKTTQTIPETVAVKGEFTITTAEHDEDIYKMGADSIEDNIKVLEDYGAMLDALKARGADESTLSSILDMDIEDGMKYGAELLKMSDSDWNSYFDSLEKLNNKAAEISAKYYQDQISDLKENFVDKLRSVFDGLSSDMYQVGVDVAEEFVKGWNKKMGTEDLTLGDIMSSVSTGTMATAPTAAKSMSALGAIVNMPSTLNSIKTNIPIYIGTQKLVDLIVDLTNGKIIQTGKNVLLT